jgi:hypothetical protein
MGFYTIKAGRFTVKKTSSGTRVIKKEMMILSKPQKFPSPAFKLSSFS